MIYYEASLTQASSLGYQGIGGTIKQVRLPEPAVYYDYVYAIKQGVDSTNRVVEPVELVLLHVHYKASLLGLSTRASPTTRPLLRRPLY